MDWAAYNSHLEVIEWLHNNRTEGCTINIIYWIIRIGYLKIIKWLKSK